MDPGRTVAMKSIRVPARMVEYMRWTGWGQEQDGPGSPADVRLRDLMEHAPRNADESMTITAPDIGILGRLVFDAEHLKGSLMYGDNTPDALADYNAGLAMERRVEKVLGRRLDYHEASAIVFADDLK